jgi:hypothetical protein
MNAKESLGVYCLGHNGVLDWMVSFLESFSSFEPTRELMIRECSSVAFNAGAFAALKGLVALEEIQALAHSSVTLRDEVAILGDQPFTNYLVDRIGLRKRRYCEIVPSASYSHWANSGPIDSFKGEYKLRNPDPRGGGVDPLFMHWAGFKLGPLMPHRKLFLEFRHKGRPKLVRLACYVLEPFLLAWVLLQAARRQACRGLRKAS